MGTRSTIVGIVCLALLLASMGVRAAISDPAPIDLLLKLVLACGVAGMCVADSRRIGRPMAGLAPVAIVIVWPVAVPVYLVWSRGWRSGLMRTGAFLLSVAVLLLVPFYLAGYAVWGDAFFRTD